MTQAQRIVADTAMHVGGVEPPTEMIVAFLSVEDCVTAGRVGRQPEQGVVTSAAEDQIGPVEALDSVVAVAAEQAICALFAADRIVAGATIGGSASGHANKAGHADGDLVVASAAKESTRAATECAFG